MRYLKYGLVLAACSMTLASCSDFLTEDPQGKLTPDTFFSTKAEVEMSVNALYAQTQAWQCNSNTCIPFMQGDDMTANAGSNKQAYASADGFSKPTDEKGLRDTWSRSYSIIKAANLIINSVHNADGKVNASVISQAEGQALAWRAIAYFNLVRLWGPVPMPLSDDINDTRMAPSPVADVYAQILSDLEKADAIGLPVAYEEGKGSYQGTPYYITPAAVKSMLAAVHMSMAGYPLNQADHYAKAAAYAKTVIDNQAAYGITFSDDYAEVYNYGNNYNKEVILGINYREVLGGWGSGDSQVTSSNQFESQGGWGDAFGEAKFWMQMPAGARKDYTYARQILLKGTDICVDWWATVDGQPYNGTNAVVPEYHPMFCLLTLNAKDGVPTTTPYDYRAPFWEGMCANKRHQLIRFSEVLLWYAESAARSGGDLAAAKAALKKVRHRATGSDVIDGKAIDAMGTDELATAAFREHGWEIAGNWFAVCTRRADQFRLNLFQAAVDYRLGTPDVIVPAGTVTASRDASGQPFTYTTTEDLRLKEPVPMAAWQGVNSIYQEYPSIEVEKNPNLVRNAQ